MKGIIGILIEGYQYNTTAGSLYEAVSDAMTAFESDWWKGPRWTAETVFDVHLVYDSSQRWTVRASDVLKWRATSGK